MIEYFALYVADTVGYDQDGYSYTCVGLFGRDELLAELRVSHLREPRAILIEPGVMPQAEWDALEEVPDDFRPTETAR